MRFRRRPETFTALQFRPLRRPWPKGVRKVGGVYEFENAWGDVYSIKSGDWIVTHERGFREVCDRDAFEATYEPMEDR